MTDDDAMYWYLAPSQFQYIRVFSRINAFPSQAQPLKVPRRSWYKYLSSLIQRKKYIHIWYIKSSMIYDKKYIYIFEVLWVHEGR